MKRRTVLEISVFLVLVAAGAFSRIYFRDLPNFAPIAAIALFSGYFFRSSLVALLVPLTAMAASDAVIGTYEWQMMLVVYGMLALPVAFRGIVRKYLQIERGQVAQSVPALAGLLGCSLGSSVLFFLVTNFALFPWSYLYEKTFDGMVQSYVQALPFFRYTLTGDLFFGVVLFGAYALAVNFGWLTEQSQARELTSDAA